MHTPQSTPLNHVGFSAQRIAARKAAPTVAPSDMSVVANPASANIVGNSVNKPVATTATALPNICHDQAQTTRQASRKKGRLPNRIRNTVRSKLGECVSIESPSWLGLDTSTGREPSR